MLPSWWLKMECDHPPQRAGRILYRQCLKSIKISLPEECLGCTNSSPPQTSGILDKTSNHAFFLYTPRGQQEAISARQVKLYQYEILNLVRVRLLEDKRDKRAHAGLRNGESLSSMFGKLAIPSSSVGSQPKKSHTLGDIMETTQGRDMAQISRKRP